MAKRYPILRSEAMSFLIYWRFFGEDKLILLINIKNVTSLNSKSREFLPCCSDDLISCDDDDPFFKRLIGDRIGMIRFLIEVDGVAIGVAHV